MQCKYPNHLPTCTSSRHCGTQPTPRHICHAITLPYHATPCHMKQCRTEAEQSRAELRRAVQSQTLHSFNTATIKPEPRQMQKRQSSPQPLHKTFKLKVYIEKCPTTTERVFAKSDFPPPRRQYNIPSPSSLLLESRRLTTLRPFGWVRLFRWLRLFRWRCR